ncbi:Six-hairpin glycosidase-like protein [Cantharellus anzutake]|uniref:Six-hairpin glycosidase-like protein n=1 Tax=Cantharellus anzutake TaxID=1750568 RepID=UPI001905C480|nr:Six-hairpin glycosidase-like protein [Cantharellus anzutake]KAF8332825.1 Six-hairpin glycosidase-like protein [Cantharellus anzutake]
MRVRTRPDVIKTKQMPRVSRQKKCLFLIHLVPFVYAQLPIPSQPFQPPPASSGAIRSNSSTIPNPQWSNLLGDLLWFYDAQRSGNLSTYNRVSWRNNSALSDNPSGGFYDAGGMYGSMTWTLTSICWGATSFGSGYDLAQQTPYLDSILRWAFQYLINAQPNITSLVVQVGDASIDNNYWGGDQNIPTPRPTWLISTKYPGTDVAASAAAAYAACSILYNGTSLYPSGTKSNHSSIGTPANLTDLTFSKTLLRYAQNLFAFARDTQPQQVYSQSLPSSVGSSYPSSGYLDDQALAALFLAAASLESPYSYQYQNSSNPDGDAKYYYEGALNLFKNSSLGGGNGALNWDNKVPALGVLGVQVSSMYEPWSNTTDFWTQEAERYLDNVVNGQGYGHLTQGGLLYYQGDSNEASLNPALNAAMLLSLYAPLATNDTRRNSYEAFAASQRDYVLGNNPMEMPYVVGVNPNSPRNPHSALASGGNDTGTINTYPTEEAHVLYGAVVGGPDKNDQFWDIRSDWPETEVALDYNAPLLTIAAANVISNTQDPFYTVLQAGAYESKRPKQGTHPCDAVFSCGKGTASRTKKIVIAVVVTVVGLGVIAALVYTFWFRKKYKGKSW